MANLTTKDEMMLVEIAKIAPLIDIVETKLIPNGGVRLQFENGDVLKTYLRSLYLILSKPPTAKSEMDGWKKLRRSILHEALKFQMQRNSDLGIT